MNRFYDAFMLCFTLLALCSSLFAQEKTKLVEQGDLIVLFRDNSESPQILSGLQSLFHTESAPEYDAFDPDQRGASAGLNFEHIISGHSNKANKFTPRHGYYPMTVDEQTGKVTLTRKAEESPWNISSQLTYQIVAPHYVDFEFRCQPQEATVFGERNYAIFFFADYMNQVRDVALHFRGVEKENGQETWVRGEAPQTHVDYIGGGTYRAVDAAPLEYDEDHNFKLNVWSYDWPRISQPYYYGLAENDMTLMLMFDKLYTAEDEIRFSLFKFKVKEEVKKPAWDFQYVIHNIDEKSVYEKQEYGFKGRLLWKKFVSQDDCQSEYHKWQKTLP